MVQPENASQAVRRRPMRRGRLTVPPAPGTSPRPISGRAICVSVRRHHGVGEGGELDAGPHAGAVQVGRRRLAASVRQRAPDAALAGGRGAPSPGRAWCRTRRGRRRHRRPGPRRAARPGDPGSAAAKVSASTSASRIRASSALSRSGSGQGEDQRRPSRFTRTRAPSSSLGADRMRGPPCRELGPRLQDRVGRGLGHQPVVDGRAAAAPGAGGPAWPPRWGTSSRFSSIAAERRVARRDDDVAQSSQSLVDRLRGDTDDDERQAGQRCRAAPPGAGIASSRVDQ